jgi:peptidyl-prolyl cis-trans isomerase-like 4
VEEGLEILEKINSSYCDGQGRPYKDIRIRHTYVIDDPFEDPEGLKIPPSSPEPVKDSDRLLEEELVDTNLDPETLEENIKEEETKTRAVVLEMIGDLPDAEIRPPDNVAFVCRLNPATTSSDLYVIFSRFGPVKSCEVIKDWKTGDSLQYAFVEFENTRDCEEAVLKMDGILIDERRIHVDFSQSVAKLWKKYRRGKRIKQIEEEGPIKIKENAHQARFKQHRHKMVFDEDSKQKRRKRERSRERDI